MLLLAQGVPLREQALCEATALGAVGAEAGVIPQRSGIVGCFNGHFQVEDLPSRLLIPPTLSKVGKNVRARKEAPHDPAP